MPLTGTPRPEWLTFDCYGTLIQWDEGLLAAVGRILAEQEASIDPRALIRTYDTFEHAFEQELPHRPFRELAGMALQHAMADFDLDCSDRDVETLTASIPAMPPFPEVVGALGALKQAGFRLCITSNTDDALIAGNVAQLGGHIDRVITAEQAGAYKPSPKIFNHAHRALGVTKDDIVHICASPQLDLVAARDLGFRCIWIDRDTGRKAPADYVPDAVLSRLDEVPPLFAGLGWM